LLHRVLSTLRDSGAPNQLYAAEVARRLFCNDLDAAESALHDDRGNELRQAHTDDNDEEF
jgi:hypothetical protein